MSSKTSWRRLADITARRLANTSWRRFRKTYCKYVLKTSWKTKSVTLKTSWKTRNVSCVLSYSELKYNVHHSCSKRLPWAANYSTRNCFSELVSFSSELKTLDGLMWDIKYKLGTNSISSNSQKFSWIFIRSFSDVYRIFLVLNSRNLKREKKSMPSNNIYFSQTCSGKAARFYLARIWTERPVINGGKTTP